MHWNMRKLTLIPELLNISKNILLHRNEGAGVFIFSGFSFNAIFDLKKEKYRKILGTRARPL